MLYNIPFTVNLDYITLFEDAFIPTKYYLGGFVYVKVSDYFTIETWLKMVSDVLHTDYDGPIGDEDQDTIGLLRSAIAVELTDVYKPLEIEEMALVKETIRLINDLRYVYGDNRLLEFTTDATALIEVT